MYGDITIQSGRERQRVKLKVKRLDRRPRESRRDSKPHASVFFMLFWYAKISKIARRWSNCADTHHIYDGPLCGKACSCTTAGPSFVAWEHASR